MKFFECCYKCGRRHMYCHTTCRYYKEDRAKLDEWNKELKKQKEAEAPFFEKWWKGL